MLREVERWVAEARVAADVSSVTLEWDTTEIEGGERDDSRERWALEKLCDALLEKGGLVPLSKKLVLRNIVDLRTETALQEKSCN